MHNGRLSAVAFLDQEAQVARAAIVRTLQDLKEDVKSAADLGYWTRRHPWAAVGLASLAGFLAATAVVPSRGADAGGDHEPQPSREGGLARGAALDGLSWLVVPLVDLLKTLVETYVTGAIQSRSQASAPGAGVQQSSSTSREATETGQSQ
jgi:hypothetical protein